MYTTRSRSLPRPASRIPPRPSSTSSLEYDLDLAIPLRASFVRPHSLSRPLSRSRSRSRSRPSSSSSLESDFDHLSLSEAARNTHFNTRALSSSYNTHHNPLNTPYLPFVFTGTHWTRTTSAIVFAPLPHAGHKPLQFFTWNLSFFASHPSLRLHAALTHLHTLTSPGTPAIIALQGVAASALTALLSHAWVQHEFAVTDLEPLGPYFTVTLVSRRVQVTGVLRVKFPGSLMGRDVLIVDVAVQGRQGVLRVANTHLESTKESVRERPRQLGVVAGFLRQPGVIAGVVGGDMNAICPGEGGLPEARGVRLRDAWALNGRGWKGSGGFGEGMGHTWGYQTEGRTAEAPSRRDKILYTGSITFGASAGKVVRRVGIGLQYRCPDDGRYGNNYKWVSDHFGLATHIIIGDNRM